MVGVEVDEDVVVLVDAVEVGGGAFPLAAEELATDEAAVDVRPPSA